MIENQFKINSDQTISFALFNLEVSPIQHFVCLILFSYSLFTLKKKTFIICRKFNMISIFPVIKIEKRATLWILSETLKIWITQY